MTHHPRTPIMVVVLTIIQIHTDHSAHDFKWRTLSLGLQRGTLVIDYCLDLILLLNDSCNFNVNIRLAKAWSAIDRSSIVWKTDLSNQIKHDFFQAVVESILLYGYTKWTQNCLEKKFDGNYTRMLCAILNKFWKQGPSKQRLYCHLLSILKYLN